MSQNDMLLITGKGPFQAYHIDVECGLDTKNQVPTFTADTLEEAMITANKYVEENMVEYNFRFIDMI